MRPDIIKMTSGKAYRLDGYESYTLTAVGTGFTALLEGQVQVDFEAAPLTPEWITLATITSNAPSTRAVETPFVRVTVTSGTAIFHLQKLDRIARPDVIKMVLGKAYRLDDYEAYTLSAIGGSFIGLLEGLVQENFEGAISSSEWITLAALTDGSPRTRAVETPFIRVSVTSGTPTFHLQKSVRLKTVELPDVVAEIARRASQQVDLGSLRAVASSASTQVDATDRLEAMIANAIRGEVLYIPPGTYRVSRTLLIQTDDIELDFAGVLAPFGAFAGHLIEISGTGQAASPDRWGTLAQGNIWQMRTAVKRLTIDGGFTSSGVVFNGIDHSQISNVYVRRTKGFSVWISNCRESTFNSVACYQNNTMGALDRAGFMIVDRFLGDANNSLKFVGCESVYHVGQLVLIDAPFEITNGSQARLLDFFGFHMEDAASQNWGGAATTQSLDIARMWIKSARGVQFFGGILGGATMSATGAIVRVTAGGNISFNDPFMFSTSPAGVAYDFVAGFDYKVTRSPSLEGAAAAGMTPIRFGASASKVSIVPQMQRILNDDVALELSNTASATLTPKLRLLRSDGLGPQAQGIVFDGQASLLLQPNIAVNNNYILDEAGRLFMTGTPLKLGHPSYPVEHVVFKMHTAAPTVGNYSVVLSDGVSWKPLGAGQTTPQLVILIPGGTWIKP